MVKKEESRIQGWIGGVKKIIYPVPFVGGTKNGTSHSVSIPVEFLKELGWKERQRVVVKRQGRKLIISDWKPKPKKK